MSLTCAGYDRLSATIPVPTAIVVPRWTQYGTFNLTATTEHVLITGGLRNCVAIVAIHRARGQAQIAHADTGRLYDTRAENFTENTRRFENFRIWLQQETRATEWHIGLGSVWAAVMASTDKSVETMRSKALMLNVVKCLSLAFARPDHEICATRGGCQKWSSGRGLHAGDEDRDLSGINWQDEGTKIPYSDF